MAKCELTHSGRDKRFVRRNKSGQFKEVEDVRRSLAADRRKRTKTESKPSHGDKRDRPREIEAQHGWKIR
jgi:hypothetical protein